MNPSLVILAAAAIGLIVNTLAILAVAWKGGHILGGLEGSMNRFAQADDRIAGELILLRDSMVDQGKLMERTVTQLDDLERRVHDLEHP